MSLKIIKIVVQVIWQEIRTLTVHLLYLLKNPNIYLAILFIFIIYLFIVKSKNSIALLLITNQGIIFQLIPFIFLFIFILLFLKNLKSKQNNAIKIDIGTVATIFSILFALLFFMFQNTQDIFYRIQSLQIITTANCEYSKNITPRNFFSYDIYNQNIAFILNQFGPEAVGITYRAISGMEKANMISDNNQNLPQILSDVKKTICDELGPTMYSKTKIVNYSFGSAIYELVTNFFLL